MNGTAKSIEGVINCIVTYKNSLYREEELSELNKQNPEMICCSIFNIPVVRKILLEDSTPLKKWNNVMFEALKDLYNKGCTPGYRLIKKNEYGGHDITLENDWTINPNDLQFTIVPAWLELHLIDKLKYDEIQERTVQCLFFDEQSTYGRKNFHSRITVECDKRANDKILTIPAKYLITLPVGFYVEGGMFVLHEDVNSYHLKGFTAIEFAIAFKKLDLVEKILVINPNILNIIFEEPRKEVQEALADKGFGSKCLASLKEKYYKSEEIKKVKDFGYLIELAVSGKFDFEKATHYSLEYIKKNSTKADFEKFTMYLKTRDFNEQLHNFVFLDDLEDINLDFHSNVTEIPMEVEFLGDNSV